jgi:hypothetical protein
MSSTALTSIERRAMAAAAARLGVRSRQNGESSQPPSGTRLRRRARGSAVDGLSAGASAARCAADSAAAARGFGATALRAPLNLPCVALHLRQALYLGQAKLQVPVQKVAHGPHAAILCATSACVAASASGALVCGAHGAAAERTASSGTSAELRRRRARQGEDEDACLFADPAGTNARQRGKGRTWIMDTFCAASRQAPHPAATAGSH